MLDCFVGEAVVSATWVWEGRSLVFKSASDVAEMVQNGSLTTWAQSLRNCSYFIEFCYKIGYPI